ncbi:MAG: MAPEG family protein [Methylophaga sp.]
MTLAVWMLLGFATWTLVLLLMTVGVYRWSRILSGQSQISEFRGDEISGADWYKRAARAHANCIENLPVFGAIVFALYVGQVSSVTVDGLVVLVLSARIAQSLIHVCFVQSNFVATLRFIFFFTQIVAFLWLILIICTLAL